MFFMYTTDRNIAFVLATAPAMRNAFFTYKFKTPKF